MKTLILVDIQNDFLPGGALSVPEGDAIIPVVNRLSDCFDLVVASMDWHPPGHISFASTHEKAVGEVLNLGAGGQQVLWPDHCIQDTYGAAHPKGLDRTDIRYTTNKGVDLKVDSYSSFFDNQRAHATGLEKYLREAGSKELYFAGLATDYCVKYSVLDALDLGFQVYVIEDACKGIELRSGDVDRALAEMCAQGAHILQSSDLLSSK